MVRPLAGTPKTFYNIGTMKDSIIKQLYTYANKNGHSVTAAGQLAKEDSYVQGYIRLNTTSSVRGQILAHTIITGCFPDAKEVANGLTSAKYGGRTRVVIYKIGSDFVQFCGARGGGWGIFEAEKEDVTGMHDLQEEVKAKAHLKQRAKDALRDANFSELEIERLLI